MQRLAYLIPRLFIIGLAGFAIWLGRDPIIRHALIYYAEQAVAAQVDIDRVSSSLSNGKVYIKNLQITDPSDPMKNLIQADLAYLELDAARLLHREFVISKGRTRNLVFGAPRTTSGKVKNRSQQQQECLQTQDHKSDSVATDLESISQNWVDQLQPTETIQLADHIESYPLGTSIQDHFNQEIASHSKTLDTIGPRMQQLKSILSAKHQNPLRNSQRMADARTELERLESEASGIRLQLQLLSASISENKSNLRDVLKRDQQKLSQLKRPNPFTGEEISQILLQQSQAELVDEVVQWFHWFRTNVPDPGAGLKNSDRPGATIQLAGTEQRPQFLIRELELEGEGRFANQHLNFAGTAYNLTTQPELLDQPARFELRAQGSQHVIIECSIDRRSPIPIDKLHILCPDLEIAARSLGHHESLLVALGPASRVQAEMNIQLEGNTLTGEIVLHHSNVSLHVDRLHDLAGGADTALKINQDLASLKSFRTTLSLAGTLDDISYQFVSDLGPQFSASADRAVLNDLEHQLEEQISSLNNFVQSQIEYLDQQATLEINQLHSRVAEETIRIAEMKSTLNSGKRHSWSDIR